MMNKIIIAIDGHSSTGKSTVAKQLAKAIGYTYVDTGAMYRSVALYAMQNNIITTVLNVPSLIKSLSKIELRFVKNEENGAFEASLNGVNVEKQIRTLEVSNWVSKVAAIPEVRKKLVEQQQEMGLSKGLVMDGRDIGTVVFPKAELKLFMTASAKVRAQRRFDEMISKGEEVSFDAVYKNVVERDAEDSSRVESPLIQAKDAILIDNSNLTREEQFTRILQLVEQKVKLVN